MTRLKIKLLHEDAKLPVRANPTDSGVDLYALEEYTVKPHSSSLVSTGIAVQLPEGHEGQVRPKSGITAKTPIRVQLGTVDNEYSGEIKIMVDNISDQPFRVDKDKKIAQLVVTPVAYPEVQVVEEFENINEGSRGSNGFGSTGLD